MNVLNVIKNAFKSETNQVMTHEQLSTFFDNELRNIAIGKSNIFKSSDVYACVNLIASNIARMGINLYQRTEQGKQVVNSDLIYLLKTRPNPSMTPFDFVYQLVANMLVYGNSFALIKTNSKGIPKELEILSGDTKVRKTSNGYVVDTVIDNKQKTYTYEEVLHIKDAQYNGGIEGYSRIDAIIDKIESKFLANNVLKNLFENDGVFVKGIINVEGALKDEAKLKLKKAFVDALGKNGIGVLEGGMRYEKIGDNTNLVDIQFIESLKLTTVDIASIFGLNTALLGNTEQTNYSNLVEIYNNFIQSLVPTITKIEQEFSYKLQTTKQIKEGYFLKFNVTSMLRANDKDQADYLCKLIEKGIITLNEAREKLDFNSIGDLGDINRVDLNHVSIDKVDNYQLNKAGVEGGENNE